MTTLKAVVRKPRTDGFYSVYIRIVHNRKPAYIKTDKIISSQQVGKNGELSDPIVNEYCAGLIRLYIDRLNRIDSSLWDTKEVLDYLLKADEDVSFSNYAQKHIDKIESEGRHRSAKNYKLALAHLERFIGSTNIMFNQLTTTVLKKWIDSLARTNRAKESYPTCIRQIFKSALIELNDEERNVIRIKFNPWMKIQIPKSDTSMKRAISAEECREFFNSPLPESKMILSLPELGRDVALLSLCLGGINTVYTNLKRKTIRTELLDTNGQRHAIAVGTGLIWK